MTPDPLDVGFGQQSFHLILKFLAYQVIFQNRDDQDFSEFWHGMVCENPTMNNLCSGNQGRDHNGEDGQCQEGEVYSDTQRPWAKMDRDEFPSVHCHVVGHS